MDIIDDTKRAKPVNTPPEEFYNKPDSCYIRVQYYPDKDAFKFEIRNELYNAAENPDNLPREATIISAFVRGMVEIAMAYPVQMYQQGVMAQTEDVEALKEAPDNLTDAQKALFQMSPVGKA